jgi:hypothetical protein
MSVKNDAGNLSRVSAKDGNAGDTNDSKPDGATIQVAKNPEREIRSGQWLEPHCVRACARQRTWHAFSPNLRKAVGLVAMVDEISNPATNVIDGKMIRPEAMLIAQAHSLDAIFNEFARRAALNMGEYLDAAETFMRLALKAQSQCRATLETLATIKNPPAVAFVKQANIAHGPQQINNGTDPPRAREIAKFGKRTFGARSQCHTVGRHPDEPRRQR